MKYTPEPHQIIAREFLTAGRHRALGDQRGLGKTVSALLAADAINARTGLVTCPASVRTNWYEHLEEQFGHVPGGWDVISYDGATDDLRRLILRDRYDVWIGDEFHKCKNTDSQRSLAVLGHGGLAARARYKWPMSGTFAPNGRPIEMYPMLKTLCPAFASYSYGEYTQRFCGAHFDGRERNVKGASHEDEFAELLKGFLLRRTKREVYPDRLDPLISPVAVDLTPGYLARIRELEDEIGGREARLSSRYEDFCQLGDTARMQHYLGIAIAPQVARFVNDLLATEDKVVVFAHHQAVIGLLLEDFNRMGHAPVYYGGGMKDRQKDEVKAHFMNSSACRIFIGQDQTSGEGINGLQRVCSTCVVAEPGWVPGDTEQMIGRLDRMGQEEDLVTAYIMFARGTLLETKWQVHGRKERTAARILGDLR